jgi:viroplasmin and RNaseH domain-containing protein
VGFSGAKYKSFPTRGLAEKALQQGREHYYQIIPKKKVWKSRGDLEDVPFVKEAIAVDAACSDNP